MRRLLFVAVAICLVAYASAEEVTVVSASASVYSRISLFSDMVASIKAGDKVDLVFSVQSSGSDWCYVVVLLLFLFMLPVLVMISVAFAFPVRRLIPARVALAASLVSLLAYVLLLRVISG